MATAEDLLFQRFCERRDPAALAEVFDRTAKDLLTVAVHLCGRRDLAEDLVQQTFLAAIGGADAFEPGRGVFPWLVGILANQARLQHRQRSRRIDLERLREPAAADPAALAAHAELTASIARAIAGLGDVYRPVLALHLENGLNAKEIAAALGRPAGSVRTQLVRGLERLRRLLPAGLASRGAVGTVGTVGTVPGRGLASVREAVVQAGVQAGVQAVQSLPALPVGAGIAAGAAAGGMLIAKAWWLGATAIGLFLLSWWIVAPPASEPELLQNRHSPVATVAAATATAPAGTPSSARGAAREPVASGLEPARGDLRVRVRGPLFERVSPMESVASSGGGATIQGVVVRVFPGSVPLPRGAVGIGSGTTDANGEVLLRDLPAGTVLVQCRVGFGREGVSEVVVVPGTETVSEIFAAMNGILRGRVVDEAGLGVAQADVWLGAEIDAGRAPTDLLRWGVRCDAEGRFEVAFAQGEERIAARKAGYAGSPSQPTQSTSGEIRLVLTAVCSTVRGFVFDSAGRPLAHASVGVQHEGQGSERGPDGTLQGPRLALLAFTDAAGGFAVVDLAPGVHRILAAAPGHRRAEARFAVEPGGRAEVTLQLEPVVEVSGTVTDGQGRRLNGVLVSVTIDEPRQTGAQTVRTDGEGSFLFEAVPARRLRLSALRLAGSARVETVLAPPFASPVVQDLVLPDRPGIRGRVLDCKGQPADGFVVGVAIAGASDVGSAPTGGGGLFVIPDLGAGDHRLMVTRPGAQGILVEQVVAAGSDDVVLRLPIDTRASGEARGRFLDANGRPFAPFAVISTADGFPQTLLIADGGFRAVELAVGEYELFAEAEGYQFLRHRFRVEADKVVDLGDLSMRAAACLSVRVLRPDGSPWRDRPPAPWLMSSDGVRLQKGVDFRCRESGAAIVFDCLPGGRYIVQVPDHDGLATLPVEVDLREGGALRIDLPTAVGFRRTLVFATSFGADRGPIAVELRRSGEPVVNAMAFATALAPGTVLERSLPPADYEVTGVDAKGGRYRAQFAVRGGADSHVVPVPRVE